MKATRPALLAAMAIPLFFLGCSRYGNELQYVKYGTIAIQVTDAPFPHKLISEANVTILKIEARRTGFEGGEATFEVLYEGEESINLLELTNGVTKSMGEVQVPVGLYDLVRVYVKESSMVLLDGTVFELGGQTDTKSFINQAIFVEGGLQNTLLLDFDVSRSFVLKGVLDVVTGITGFDFEPVVKASDMATTGTLTGTVTTSLLGQIETSLPGVQLSIMAADTLNTTTFTDLSGEYTVLGLDPGTYTVTAESIGFAAETFEDIVISKGMATNQDFQLSIGL